MEIHFHGYDIEKQIEPGSDTVMTFELIATGRFPVTVHAHSHSGNHGEQTLLYVEVYPQ
ncbi:MAG: hypothetical protein HOC23_03035 [Halieaceae bacterium]|nr:hypothetical protein [Halieaceae bacterium]